MAGIAPLDNPVQQYSWGSRTFIPRLLGRPFPTAVPQAELWMGAHPQGPSRAFWEGRWVPLSDLIKKNPAGILGKPVAARFGDRLPFLLKVLAASKPLSIQAHPNREQAVKGFEREEKLAIPVEAPHRTYRDPFHKPEILCALTPFHALKGFRAADEIRATLLRTGLVPKRLPLLRDEGDDTVKKTFQALFTMSREEQRRLVSDLVSAATTGISQDPVLEWIVRLQEVFPYDIGVFGPVFLNLILLQPGEALSVAAGELHAYLEGAGIEVMANSDNVLRGGLTEKHMDVPELFGILNPTTGQKRIFRPRAQGSAEAFYPGGTEEFVLSRIVLEPGMLYQSPLERGIEIMICVEGGVEVSNLETGEMLSLPCGSSAMVPALVRGYRVEGDGALYKAAVPLQGHPFPKGL
jgi:mannose-6-phosphate isomerase